MSEQNQSEQNKILQFIENFGTFSVLKKILYLIPLTVLWLLFLKFYGIDGDFDSLLWLIPLFLPLFPTLLLVKLVWFNLILGKVETIKTKSIISIVLFVSYIGGFHGFNEMFKLRGENDFIMLIDLILLLIQCLSGFYILHYLFLTFFRGEKGRVEVLRRVYFNDRYK